jgi:hypothetical protein
LLSALASGWLPAAPKSPLLPLLEMAAAVRNQPQTQAGSKCPADESPRQNGTTTAATPSLPAAEHPGSFGMAALGSELRPEPRGAWGIIAFRKAEPAKAVLAEADAVKTGLMKTQSGGGTAAVPSAAGAAAFWGTEAGPPPDASQSTPATSPAGGSGVSSAQASFGRAAAASLPGTELWKPQLPLPVFALAVRLPVRTHADREMATGAAEPLRVKETPAAGSAAVEPGNLAAVNARQRPAAPPLADPLPGTPSHASPAKGGEIRLAAEKSQAPGAAQRSEPGDFEDDRRARRPIPWPAAKQAQEFAARPAEPAITRPEAAPLDGDARQEPARDEAMAAAAPAAGLHRPPPAPPAAAASGPPPAPEAPVQGGPLVEQASLRAAQNGSQMELRLRPDDMGRLALRVSERSGQVEVAVRTDSPSLKSLLAGSLPSLLDQLQERGWNVSRVSQTAGEASPGWWAEPHAEQRRRQDLGEQRRRRPPPGEGEAAFSLES